MDKKLLDQLAARAEQKAKDRLEVKRFSVGGVEMQFHKLKQDEQLSYIEALAEVKGIRDAVEVSVEMIYDCCDELKDPELHKTLGVTDPHDVVRLLMDPGEIDALGSDLVDWMGFLSRGSTDEPKTMQLEDEVKNA